jgi:hypothetical protein
MSYSKKIVLNCPHGATLSLDSLVEDFLQQGFLFIAVVGPECSRVEDLIDELVVGDGRRDRFILTSSHPGESVADAISFARLLTGEYAGDEIQIVELLPPRMRLSDPLQCDPRTLMFTRFLGFQSAHHA